MRITPFQQKVYAALKTVPRGRVTTYGLLARAVGCGSPRAVGQALRNNPFAPEVPCHRVVRSDLTIGGFEGRAGGGPVRKKKALLLAEGVPFAGPSTVAPEALFEPGRDKCQQAPGC